VVDHLFALKFQTDFAFDQIYSSREEFLERCGDCSKIQKKKILDKVISMAKKGIDYSKWDKIQDSDDDDVEQVSCATLTVSMLF
jgi:hypothetical protein